MIVHIYLENSL